MKKDLHKISKISFWIGIIIYFIACAIGSVSEVNIVYTWLGIIIIILVYIPLALSGYIYTSQTRVKRLKRYKVIRFFIVFYGIIIIAWVCIKLLRPDFFGGYN